MSLVNSRVAKKQNKETKHANLRFSCKMIHAKMKSIMYK